MLLVHETDPGVFELNWMWLPTWLGMNAAVKRELEAYVKKECVGKPMTLHDLHMVVVRWLAGKHPEIQGLKEHLLSLENIQVGQAIELTRTSDKPNDY